MVDTKEDYQTSGPRARNIPMDHFHYITDKKFFTIFTIMNGP